MQYRRDEVPSPPRESWGYERARARDFDLLADGSYPNIVLNCHFYLSYLTGSRIGRKVRYTAPAASPEQLDAYGCQAEPLVAKLVANPKESRTLAELRDALLPKLISGELRVRDAEAVVDVAEPM